MTTWFPSVVAPESGLFVQRDVRLLAKDHEVSVLHLIAPRLQKEASEEVIDGIVVRRFPMSPSSPLDVMRASRVIQRLLRGAEALHTMALSSLLPFALTRVSKPWIHTEHWSGIVAPESIPVAARLTLPATLRLLARPDIVVAVSTHLAKSMARHRNGPIEVISNYVMVPERVVPRAPHSGRIRLIGVGGLIPVKGPNIAISALAVLHRRGIDANLTWIGDGPLRETLQAHVLADGLADRVDFLGTQPPEVVSRCLGESDVFILPTSNETFGVSIAEALAHGRPVVTGAVGGQSEFVKAPDGVLVSDRSGDGYADGVIDVLRMSAGRTAEQIAKRANELFSEKSRRQSYRHVYASAVSQREEA